MKKKIKRTLAILLAAIMVIGMTACGNKKSESSGENLPDKITLGFWESPNGELLAKEQQLLEKKYPDVEINWVQCESGPDILTAIQGGSLDFATIGTPPATLGVAQEYPYKIFYMHDVIGESEGLIVKKDSGIKSIKDIKGKKIATLYGSTSHFSLLNALKHEGIKTTDFELYDMQAQDIYAAWQRGDIDGAYLWEPVKSQLLENGGIEIISSEQVAEQGGLTGEVGVVSNSFYEKYPNVVKDYINILDQAVQDYRDDQDNSASLMADGLGLSKKETLTTMNEIIVKDKSEQKEYLGKDGTLASVLKDTADFLYDQKSLNNKADESVFRDAILSELYE